MKCHVLPMDITVVAQQNRKSVRHRSGHPHTTGRATFSKAADWIHVESSAPASKRLSRLTFGKPHLGRVLTGLEQFSVFRPSG